MRKTTTRLTALALFLALLLTSCGGGASATSMHLRKTEGTVGVSDGEGKDVTPKENLGLYSGYQVGTQAESYAWIDLDRVKLTKMDAGSEIEIAKDGKKLEIDVKSGSLFFNVTEPLANDETMNIVTSTMMIGIRGTCGWVTENTAALLEGTVSVTAGDQEVTVTAGEMAVLTAEGKLEVTDFTPNDVPAFVVEELAVDDGLAQAVLDATGLNIPAYSMASYEELLGTLENVVYSELIDFEQDGSPELLVVELVKSEDYGGVTIRTTFFRNGPEGPQYLGGTPSYLTDVDRAVCSLAEYGGKLFVYTCLTNDKSAINNFQADFYGSLAERDGGPGDWGLVDSFIGSGRDYFDCLQKMSMQPEIWMLSARNHDEKGFASGNWGGLIGYHEKYTVVRQLYEQTF